MFFKTRVRRGTINETVESEPEVISYKFTYQICIKRHSVMEYQTTRDSFDAAQAARSEVLALLTSAIRDRIGVILFDAIGIQGDLLAWFYVGSVEASPDSKGQ